MIAVRVLDAVELHRDGERIPVRAGKTTELFVRLALEAGSMVRTDRLIEDLWAEDAAVTARNTLQATASRLRRSLGDASLVTGTAAGYTLNVDPAVVDALEVVRLAEEASIARSGGDPRPHSSRARGPWRSSEATCSGTLARASGSTRTGPGSKKLDSVCWRPTWRPASTSAPPPR